MRGGEHSANNSNGAGAGGWPLGLQPLHVMNRLAAAATSREQLFTLLQYNRRNRAASPFFISTPSISSLSSSDLDTESTGSFFPERSTTLGTLIGIHSRPHRHERPANFHNVTTHSKHQLKTAQRLHACCCAAFALVTRCASSHSHSHPSEESLSPSLAHLLELERRSAHMTEEEEAATLQTESFEEEGGGGCSHHAEARLNTLFDDHGILPPHPSGAPLKGALHQSTTSPTTSAYLSTDWSANISIERKGKHCHSHNGRSNPSLCQGFWKVC